MRVIDEQIAGFRASALGEFSDSAPWELTLRAAGIVERLLNRLGEGYTVSGNVAVHFTSTIEAGAIIKGSAIIGPGSSSQQVHMFVAAAGWKRTVFLGLAPS